jgi:hypothetical protein
MSFHIRLSSDSFKYSRYGLCSLLDHHSLISIVYEDDNDCRGLAYFRVCLLRNLIWNPNIDNNVQTHIKNRHEK